MSLRSFPNEIITLISNYHHTTKRSIVVAVLFLVGAFGLFSFTNKTDAASVESRTGKHIISVYDNGVEKGFVTDANTLREALKAAGIVMQANDVSEPNLDEKLVAPSYAVNIYRARPVLVIDEGYRTKVMTPYQTAEQIASAAQLTINPEDIVSLEYSDDVVRDGAFERLVIDRATPFIFVLYGKTIQSYTRATTVGEMLQSKNITPADNDTVSVALDTPLTAGMKIELWKNGKQTLTQDEDVDFPIEKIKDANQKIGYRDIQTPGKKGKRTVTYEVTMQNGVETSRKEIASVTIEEPTKQVEIVGAKGCANDAAANKILGHQMMLAAGFGEDQWTYLDMLWTHESGWVECKANYGGSGAYGIPQALPGSKMGEGWQDDPEVQIRWGLGYIRGRYGNPQGAYQHWRANNWY